MTSDAQPPAPHRLDEDRPPGDLGVARTFWPLLVGWTGNLLVGTDLGTRRDGDGALVAAGIELCVRIANEPSAGHDGVGPEQRIRRVVASGSGRLPSRPVRPLEPIRRNLRLIGDVAGLRRVERRVLELLVAARLVPALEQLTDAFPHLTLEHAARLLAIALAEREDDVREALGPAGRLAESGLVTVQPWPDFLERKLLVSPALPDLVVAPALHREQVLDAFAPGAPVPATIFEAISQRVPDAALARDLLAGAAREGRRGVNVLLHGPPGTGKSELARAAVRHLGLDLREIRTRPAAMQPGVEARVAMLVACDRLVRDRKSVLLFDRLEDLLEPNGPPGPGHLGARMAQAWLEDRLERSAVPTIWTATDATRVDPGLLSRFSLVLAVPALDARARRALLEMETFLDAGLSDAGADALAARFPATPAELARAVDTARLARDGRQDADDVAAVLRHALRARGADLPDEAARPAAYRSDCIHASADVESIVRALAGWTPQRGGVAILLHGLPGTGKSEWAQELGRRLGRPVLARRVSDVESKWVGESEQNLARAFREAAERGAVLLFDEVDSFLRDRAGATWRHEVQLTNEFLQQLERHPGIVACTTNLVDALDPAVLRRFPIKIEFRPSTPAQAAALFEAYFGAALGADALDAMRPALPGRLAAVGPLTPGDFAAVARRVRVTGELRTVDDALRLLREEAGLRAKDPVRAVGFAPERRGDGAEPLRLVEAAELGEPR